MERDKFLTEAMGECWHNGPFTHNPYHDGACVVICACGEREIVGPTPTLESDQLVFAMKRGSFSTWEGFGKLWEWAQKQEWWIGFAGHLNAAGLVMDIGFGPVSVTKFPCELIHPDRFTDAVYNFLRQR